MRKRTATLQKLQLFIGLRNFVRQCPPPPQKKDLSHKNYKFNQRNTTTASSWVYKFNDRALFPSRFEHTSFFAPFYIFSQSGFLGRLWYSMVLWYFCRTLARLPHISAEISHNCTCYGNVGGYFIKFINSVSFWQKCSGSYYQQQYVLRSKSHEMNCPLSCKSS